MGSIRRTAIGAGLLLATVLASAGEPAPAVPVKLDIKSQPMADALNQWAQATGLQVIFPEQSATAKLVAPEVRGRYVPAVALTKLLENSGLRYEYLNERTVVVKVAQAGQDKSSSGQEKENGRPLGVAQAQSESPQRGERTDISSPAQEGARRTDEDKKNTIQEIIVTAQKQGEQRLQDVPVPITVLSAERLAENGQVRLRDYYSMVPGLVVSPAASLPAQSIAIRGISTGSLTPTVGIVIDDVAFGASTGLGYGGIVPEIDPGDLDRIEVLRGPQGTLYGATSLGGLLKYVTKDPSTAGWSGRIEAGTESVYHGDSPGYSLRASANVPLTDTFAVRLSAFERQDAGYINNTFTGENGINKIQNDGARIAALWRPTDAWSVKLSALYQFSRANGDSNEVEAPGLGRYEQNYYKTVGSYKKSIQAYSAEVHYQWGRAQITSLTGYNSNKSDATEGSGPFINGFVQSIYGPTVGSKIQGIAEPKKFTQELRLSTPLGTNFDFLLGGYYTRESTPRTSSIPIFDTVTGRTVAPSADTAYSPVDIYKEYALFTDLTYHVNDRFEVQLGGRASQLKMDYQSSEIAPLFDYVAIGDLTHADAKPVTYLLTPSYKISPDLLVYARFASGYRPGGPNTVGCQQGFYPCQFGPDKTLNYEIGAKGSLVDHLLSFDLSVFHIDWKDIQLTEFDVGHSGGPFTTNATKAKSDGVELSVESKPWQGATVSAWVNYNKAELTENLPPHAVAGGTYGGPGDPLPFTSRWSGNLSIEQSFPLGSRATGYVGAQGIFVGDRKGLFVGAPPAMRQDLPAYKQFNLNAGVQYDSWRVNLYANNLGNARGLIGGGLGTNPADAFVYILPRVLGLSLSHTF